MTATTETFRAIPTITAGDATVANMLIRDLLDAITAMVDFPDHGVDVRGSGVVMPMDASPLLVTTSRNVKMKHVALRRFCWARELEIKKALSQGTITAYNFWRSMRLEIRGISTTTDAAKIETVRTELRNDWNHLDASIDWRG